MKFLTVITIFVSLVLFSEGASSPDSQYYEAGVVEFFPAISMEAGADNNTLSNLAGYLEVLNLPDAENLDIILFPETALNEIETAIYVPDSDEKVNPCDNKNYTDKDLLKKLSCAAKKGKKYVVINLTEKADCPDKEMIANKDERPCRENKLSYYNTNVVFDRNGTLIATYRKFHLFKEEVDHPKFPQVTTFETDFGVTFGTFICFDINFADTTMKLLREMKIQDIAFPSFWFSELPHATAIQVQSNWAFVNNVNLLAAGASIPPVGATGSGIYAGKLGPLISEIHGLPNTKLLTAKVPKRTSNITEVIDRSVRKTPKEMESITLYREDINTYVTEEIPLNQSKFEKKICHSENSLCCDFSLEFNFKANSSGEDFYRYRAVVFDGVRDFQGEETGNITSCYITACTNDSISSCALRYEDTSKVKDLTTFTKISISGSFKYGKNDLIFPNGVDTSIMPLNPKEFTYEEENKGSERILRIELKKDRSNLLSFGFFGRHFENAGISVSVSFTMISIGLLVTRFY